MESVVSSTTVTCLIVVAALLVIAAVVGGILAYKFWKNTAAREILLPMKTLYNRLILQFMRT